MNYSVITIEDCIDNFEKRNRSTVIENGQVVGFIHENWLWN